MNSRLNKKKNGRSRIIFIAIGEKRTGHVLSSTSGHLLPLIVIHPRSGCRTPSPQHRPPSCICRLCPSLQNVLVICVALHVSVPNIWCSFPLIYYYCKTIIRATACHPHRAIVHVTSATPCVWTHACIHAVTSPKRRTAAGATHSKDPCGAWTWKRTQLGPASCRAKPTETPINGPPPAFSAIVSGFGQTPACLPAPLFFFLTSFGTARGGSHDSVAGQRVWHSTAAAEAAICCQLVIAAATEQSRVRTHVGVQKIVQFPGQLTCQARPRQHSRLIHCPGKK